MCIRDRVELVRQQVGDKKVLLALSGGVDSSVVAALLLKAIGQQLVCVHVNHGPVSYTHLKLRDGTARRPFSIVILRILSVMQKWRETESMW